MGNFIGSLQSDLCEGDNSSTEFPPIYFVYYHWPSNEKWKGWGPGSRSSLSGCTGAVWPSVQTRCTALTTSWICLLVILSLVQFWRDGLELDYSSASLVRVAGQKVSSWRSDGGWGSAQCNSTVNKTFTIYQREGERSRIEFASRIT